MGKVDAILRLGDLYTYLNSLINVPVDTYIDIGDNNVVEGYMAEAFEVALKKAEKELADCDARISEWEHKRAQLRQTIVVLKAQLGITMEKEGSMTDAILLTLQAWSGAATVSDVIQRLTMMGHPTQPRSVATIMSRLTKQGKIRSLVGPGNAVGYEWKANLTKAERLTAQKELASKASKKK